MLHPSIESTNSPIIICRAVGAAAGSRKSEGIRRHGVVADA
jgi:hypothetical protein